MNFLYDKINLNSYSGEYHLISVNGLDLGKVVISSSLPSDGSWLKVKACINSSDIQDVYLDLNSSFIKDRVDVASIGKDSISNSHLINDLAIKNLSISDESKSYLLALMHLGINKEDYESNILETANNLFKGFNIKDKIKHYDLLEKKCESAEEKNILKDLLISIIVPELYKPVTKSNPFVLYLISKDLLKDKEFILKMMDHYSDTFSFVSDNLRDDEEVALKSLSVNVCSFEHISDRLKADPKILEFLEIRKLDGYSSGLKRLGISKEDYETNKLKIASSIFEGDSLKEKFESFRHLEFKYESSEESVILRNLMKEFFLEEVKKNWMDLSYADIFKSDKEVVMAAVRNNGEALAYASDELKSDKELVIAAVRNNGKALAYASDELKSDKEIVIAAVMENGESFSYASDELKDNEDFVLEVIGLNISAFSCASSRLRDSKDLILKIASQNGMVINFISGSLNSDPDILIAALKQNIMNVSFIPYHLINNSEINHAILMKCVSDLILNISLLKDKLDSVDLEQIEQFIQGRKLDEDFFKYLGLDNAEILKTIILLVKEVVECSDSDKKIYFISIIKSLSKESAIDSLNKVLTISGGEKNLFLLALSLSSLNIDKSMQEYFHDLLKIKVDFFKDKITWLLYQIIELTKNPKYNQTGNFDDFVDLIKLKTVGSVLKEKFNPDLFVKEALVDDGCLIRKIKSEFIFRDPYLIFISKQRNKFGDSWPLKLADMPLNVSECLIINEQLGGPVDIKPEDIKILVHLYFNIYPYIVDLYSSGFRDLSDIFQSDFEKYQKECISNKQEIIASLFTFNGLRSEVEGFGISGNISVNSCLSIADAVDDCEISVVDKSEFSEALRRSVDFSKLNDDTVRKIKNGEFVIISVGFKLESGGHDVSLIFYGDQFIICNRGARFSIKEPVIKVFKFEVDRIDLNVLKYLTVISKVIEFKTSLEGVFNQYLQLELVLPKILNATKITEEVEDTYPSFKSQTSPNCTKASPLTAVKIGIYLKLIKEGILSKEAGIISKKVGDEISIKLRQNSIDKAKILLESKDLDEDLKLKLTKSIEKAEMKLDHKKAKKDLRII